MGMGIKSSGRHQHGARKTAKSLTDAKSCRDSSRGGGGEGRTEKGDQRPRGCFFESEGRGSGGKGKRGKGFEKRHARPEVGVVHSTAKNGE